MGVWNAHTSIGNILGNVIPAALLGYGWLVSCALTCSWGVCTHRNRGWGFMVPSFIMLGVTLIVALFCPICT